MSSPWCDIVATIPEALDIIRETCSTKACSLINSFTECTCGGLTWCRWVANKEWCYALLGFVWRLGAGVLVDDLGNWRSSWIGEFEVWIKGSNILGLEPWGWRAPNVRDVKLLNFTHIKFSATTKVALFEPGDCLWAKQSQSQYSFSISPSSQQWESIHDDKLWE